MDNVPTLRELHEQIARYWRFRRMTLDKQTLEALSYLTAEAEAHLRQLEPQGRLLT